MIKFVFYLALLTCQVLSAQNNLGLQVDSNLVVLFGRDTTGGGNKFMWLPSKAAVFMGELMKPFDSIGHFSLSIGQSMASGMASMAAGISSAQGDYSVALSNSSAIGNLSFSTGLSTSFGGLSTALGHSITGGHASVAGGNSSTNADLAVAFGNSRSTGDISAAFNKAKAEAYLSTAIGRYNIGGGDPVNYVSTDPIFEVGIGSTEANRRNAFTIRKDGFISMGSHLANTKFALYQLGTTTYGMGVVAGQFRFNIGNPQARYAFFDQPGSNATEVFTIWGNGNIAVLGTTVHSSDKNRKEHIVPIDYDQVLNRISELPISEWQYKGQKERHFGPMAQDFHAAFGLGGSDTTIASVDADGVALAAIKALIGQVDVLKKEIANLKNSMADCRQNK